MGECDMGKGREVGCVYVCMYICVCGKCVFLTSTT